MDVMKVVLVCLLVGGQLAGEKDSRLAGQTKDLLLDWTRSFILTRSIE